MRRSSLLLFLLAAGCGRAADPAALVARLAQTGRVAAFAELEQHQEPSYRQAVLGGLQHPDPRVRCECLRLIERWKDITVVDTLVSNLADPAAPVRFQAARTLYQLLNADELLEVLQESSLSEPAQAAVVSAILRDPLALSEPRLLDWMTSDQGSTRLRAYRLRSLAANCSMCLGCRKGEEDLRVAVESARRRLVRLSAEWLRDDGSDLEVRSSAALLYATVTGPASYPELHRLAQSAPQRLREATLTALGASHAPQARAELLQLAADENRPLSERAAAMRGLSSFSGEPEVASFLMETLKNSDASMRVRAAQQLSEAGLKQALPALRQAVSEEVDPVTQAKLQCSLQSLEGCQVCGETPDPGLKK